MRRPNYDYAKRQKEIAKQKKKEEKKLRKSTPGQPEDTDATTPSLDADPIPEESQPGD